MLTRYLRYIAFAALAALAYTNPVAAHHGNDDIGAPQAPGAASATLSLQGHVDQIVVENKITGSSRRFPVLAADDGRRFALVGPGVDGLVTGTAISVSGKQNGHALFPDSVQTIAAADSRRTVAKAASASTFSGMLRLAHADNFDGNPSEFFYALDSGTGRHTRVELATSLGVLKNGMRVTISGNVAASGELVPDHISIVALGEVTATSGPVVLGAPVTKNYLVIPIKFPNADGTFGADPFTPASLNTAVFGATGSVKEYYNEVSYGQQLLSGVVADNGFGGFLQAAVAAPSCADYYAIGAAAEAAANARGYNVASYAGILYVFNNVSGCGWSGLAYVGWARAWSNNTANLLVIAHELGHNFGLLHAASLDCGANVIGGACSSSEYGDPFDVMGNNRAMHFNSAQKSMLNWLPAGTVSTHTSGAATYTLAPLETAGGSLYAVKVPVSANRTYWIEYRQPIGFDAGLSSFPNNGAQIRVASPFESVCSGCDDDTEFLDMTPATAAFTDGALVAGQSYTDTTYNVAFNVISATAGAGGRLTLQVTSGGGSPTTTTLASNSNPSVSGASVTFTATVTGTAPTGSVNFKDGATSIAGCSAVAVTGSGNARTAACSTSALTAGTHSISAAYGGDAGNGASTSSALSQAVTKAATVTTISAHTPNPVNVGMPIAVAAGVSVTFPGVGNPSGTITVSDGTANCVITLPATACNLTPLTVGAKTLTAVYAGDANFTGSTSAGVAHTVNAAINTGTVWVEDTVPAGAVVSTWENWTWVGSNPAPYSGALAHQSGLLSGVHQHYFYNASATLAVGVGDTLFTYVYLDPANPPSEVMLQWYDGSWEHRAYWGANQIAWGTDGSASRRYMGALPPAGGWVRLEVPAAQVGLESRTLSGMAYTLYDGRATWDYTGKASAATPPTLQVSGTVTLNGAALSGVSFTATGGASCTRSNGAGQYACAVPQGWSGTITPFLSGYNFTPPSRGYSNVVANQTTQGYTAAINAATVWLEDTVPAGAAVSTWENWTWVASNPVPYSGALAHQSGPLSGVHQHYFYNASATLAVGVGETLFAYVYLDPANPPSEVMLQWNDGSWEHRAYWGENQIAWGTDGSVSRRYMGALPPAGQWVRLDVPAAQVGLEGRTLNGMAFTLYDGRATWDYVGK